MNLTTRLLGALMVSALVAPAAMAKSTGPGRSRTAHAKVHKAKKRSKVETGASNSTGEEKVKKTRKQTAKRRHQPAMAS